MKIFIFLLFVLFFAIFFLLMECCIEMLDHFEILSIAADDYQKDAENFDISHYPDVTLSEIQTYIKRHSERKRNDLQSKCNDNPDFIFDE